MHFEKKIMQRRHGDNGFFGIIELDRPAKPETVRVRQDGHPIIPQSFNLFGFPLFTEEQDDLYRYDNMLLRHKTKDSDARILLDVEYEAAELEVSRDLIDTKEGIRGWLGGLKSFTDLLCYRKLYNGIHPDEDLHEFLVYGRYHLGKYGQIVEIIDPDSSRVGVIEDWNVGYSQIGRPRSTAPASIPDDGEICPCCGVQLTISDVITGTLTYARYKNFHSDCWHRYRQLTEVYNLTDGLMDPVYPTDEYTYELIPNGYWDTDDVPWLKFSTKDGDIIIGWRKRVISIEWQENYKSFDFEDLFSGCDVTKWQKSGRRGIHAWSINDAMRYLDVARKAVDPEYGKP